MMQELPDQWRLYSLVNGLYMKEIQWGIQTTHGVSAMMIATADQLISALSGLRTSLSEVQRCDKITELSTRYEKLKHWAELCPTVIVCDAVNVAGLNTAWETVQFYADAFDLPHAKFHEDMDSLGGVITNVCILMPRNFFNATPESYVDKDVYAYVLEDGTRVRRGGDGTNGWTFTLIDFVKQLRLVR